MTIPRWVGDKPWSVNAVYIWENHYGLTRLDAWDLAGLGFDQTLLFDSGQDFGLPTLAAHTRTPSTVDTRAGNKKVTVQVHLRYANSGLAGATASFRSGLQVSTRLTRVSGTRYNGVWRGVITIPRCTSASAGVHTWDGTVTFSDRAGNQRTVGPTLGASADIRVNSRDNKPHDTSRMTTPFLPQGR